MDKLSLGQRIKRLRGDKKWSQSKLAEIIDISDYALSNIETGKYYPRLDTFTELCNAFTIPGSFLVSDDEDINAICLYEIRKYLLIFDERIVTHILEYIEMCSNLCDELATVNDNKTDNL